MLYYYNTMKNLLGYFLATTFSVTKLLHQLGLKGIILILCSKKRKTIIITVIVSLKRNLSEIGPFM